MPDARKRRRLFFDDVSPSIRGLLNRDFESLDRSISACWTRFHIHHRETDFDLIFRHYAPLVGMVLRRLRRHYPAVFQGECGDFISDGFLALASWIRRTPPLGQADAKNVCASAIRRGMFKGLERMAFEGSYRSRALWVVSAIRGRLRGVLGREPNREEVAGEIRRRMKRPELYISTIDYRPSKVRLISELVNNDSGRPLETAISREPDPSTLAERSEFFRLAMVEMIPLDRRIVKLLIGGKNVTEAARVVGLSRQRIHQRLARILQTLRKNRRLQRGRSYRGETR